MKRYLLCTDLDRTLIPNGVQPESAAAMERFRRLASRQEITLVYVTGRHRTLIEQAIKDFNLPQPDFAIADVGTTIYQIRSSGWDMLDEWDAQIAPDWKGLTHDDLYRLLSVFAMLKLQEEDKQNRHKLSFYAPLETDAKKLLSEIDMRLKHGDIKANLVWSTDANANIGLLDVLPRSANKLHAIRFLMQLQKFHYDDTIFAGDSGNDLDAFAGGISGVLVANADAEVKKQVATLNKVLRHDAIYVAEGGYLGMNGNYSAGVLEGVAHHWPEVDRWLREMN